MNMTASGYGFVGLISLSYTNEPLGTRRRKKSRERRKVQKRTMIIADVA